jgi:hypothetical protein
MVEGISDGSRILVCNGSACCGIDSLFDGAGTLEPGFKISGNAYKWNLGDGVKLWGGVGDDIYNLKWDFGKGIKTYKHTISTDYQKLREFINTRIGKDVMPERLPIIQFEGAYSYGVGISSLNNQRLSDPLFGSPYDLISKDKEGDGEILIVTSAGVSAMTYITVRADGLVSESRTCKVEEIKNGDKTVGLRQKNETCVSQPKAKIGTMSTEDASALIAVLAGREELGAFPSPSERHIESVRNLLGGQQNELGSLKLFDISPSIGPCPCGELRSLHGLNGPVIDIPLPKIFF